MSKIAILMSTYNGDEFLEEQLCSIANQITEHEISLYVRDDGSVDRTLKIIERWKNIIDIHFCSGNNLGPAKSFWSLFEDESIKADYYAFCDQDDIWDSNKIEIAIKHLQEGYCLYACNCRSINANGQVIEKLRKEGKPKISLELLFVSGITQGCAMVFTNDLREYICSKNITCVPMHDLIVCMYALSFGTFFWDQEPHFSYRFHNNNVVANKSHVGIRSKIETLKRWKKKSEDSLTVVAKELLVNEPISDRNVEAFLIDVSTCRRSFTAKLNLIRNNKIKELEWNYRMSFYFRILLNLI
mgnify:CR=1 FL=1